MGAHQSKEELVYQHVNYGNIEGIKSLRREGAGLEVSNFVDFFFFLKKKKKNSFSFGNFLPFLSER